MNLLHLSIFFGIYKTESEVREFFSRIVAYYEKWAIPGEFDGWGGPEGAVRHNVRLFLERAETATQDLWKRALPGI